MACSIINGACCLFLLEKEKREAKEGKGKKLESDDGT